jgi:hypothetical protein
VTSQPAQFASPDPHRWLASLTTGHRERETAQAAPGALGIHRRNCRSLAMCSTPSSVLDHTAQGFNVVLDEAGDDLAFEAAVLALLDDPLADYEFH